MKNICMVGNTHFDPVWLWRWNEALSSIIATFRSALLRMEEYPEFKYSFSAPAVFEWIKKTDPCLFSEIKKRIAEGRWELCEGWWLQADCNAALGESYVRQGLYAQKYFEDNFGRKSKTVFNIDSFGHPASLPQILSGCQIQNYVFWRPSEEHKHLPSPLFKWHAENGTYVNTYRIGGDGGEIFTADITEDTLNPLIDNCLNIPHDLMVVYGVTDHGGAPTKSMIEKIQTKSREEKDFVNIHFGTVEDFFENADMASVPDVKDEIQVNFIGPYSNFNEIKKNNRHAEYAVMNAERSSILAEMLSDGFYPKARIKSCWEDIMFNQFHDILGGCCIKDAFFDARNLHGRAIQTADEITYFALQSITNKIKMPGKNPDTVWNLVVWNLNGTDYNGEIEAEVQWAWEFDWYDGGIKLADGDGNEYECQIIEELSVISKFRSRFVFKAKIPAYGYKAFSVIQTGFEKKPTPPDAIENERFAVTYGSDGITLYDKEKQKDITGVLPIPYVLTDTCDTWGFNKTVYETEKEFMTLKSCKVKEFGNIRTTFRLEYEYGKSQFVQDISVYDDHIDCSYRALWNEEMKALKLAVTGDGVMKNAVSIPYGRTERKKCEFERPMGEWVKLYNDTESVTIASDSIFAYNFDGTSLGLTVLRNCIFGDLRTEPLNSDRHLSYMGQGETEGKLRITFDGNDDVTGIFFNNRPIVICEANHGGIYESESSFIEIPNGVVLGTIKKSENEANYVCRLYNTSDKQISGKVTLFDKVSDTVLNPYEIQTLCTDDNGFVKTDMLEEL